LESIPTVPTPDEQLEVEIIEALLLERRKLTKAVEATGSKVKEVKNVANFLAARRN
jgi:hypothetical protein